MPLLSTRLLGTTALAFLPVVAAANTQPAPVPLSSLLGTGLAYSNGKIVVTGGAGTPGVGVTGASISGGHLLLTLSSGVTVDSGALPTVPGPTGPNGAPGPAGPAGVAGPTGSAGAGGVSITGASVTSGHLVLTMSSGTTIDAGALPSASSSAVPIGVASAAINGSGHLVLTLTNGATTDAGLLPSVGGGSSGGTAFTGNGSPSGTPLYPVLDGATGNVTYVTTAQFQALQVPGALIQIPPTQPAIALGTPTYSTIPYTITPPASGSAPITYQVLYRITGSGAPFTPAGPSNSSLTGTIPGLAGSTGYDVEVVAANGGGIAPNSTLATATTAVAPPPTTINSAVLGADGKTLTLSFAAAVTIVPADFAFTIANAAVSAANTDGATSQTAHVFTLARPANPGAAVTFSASPAGASSPPLSAAISKAAVTNNSAANVTMVTFPGPAGAQPTGNAAMSSASEVAGLTWGPPAVDGSGNARFTNHYEYAILTALPTTTNPTITVNFASGSASQSTCILFRVDSSLTNGYIVAVQGNSVLLQLLTTSSTNPTTPIGSFTGNASSLAVSVSGSTITASVNGQVVGSVTDSRITAAGLVGFGTFNDASPMLVSSVSVQ